MKNRILIAVLSLAVVALSGCGDGSASQAEPSADSSARAGDGPGSCADSKHSESVKNEPLECKSFTSQAGRATGQDLSWVATTPLEASFGRMNGALTLVVRMPCGVLNVPVTVSATVITPDPAEMIESADGCAGPASDQRTWTTDYLSHPLEYSLDKQELVLTNGLGHIAFARSSS